MTHDDSPASLCSVTPVIPLALGAVALLALASGGSKSRGVSGPFATIPARALSQTQALTILKSLHDAGTISVTRWPSYTRSPSAPLGSFNATLDMEGQIGDVQFLYIDAPRKIDHVDPRFAVFLARLAAMLRSQFKVTRIHHLGIYPGKSETPDDVHNHGRAIDLLSFDGPFGSLSIKEDWGTKPAPYAEKAAVTRFRLKPNDRGYKLFSGLYSFLTREVSDRLQTPVQGGPPTRIGDHSFILTPDHPDPDYRPSHSGLNSHIHAQIGPTRGMDPLGT